MDNIDLNVKNINSFGLVSNYNNTFSKGNIFISDNESPNYVYLENNGKITCKNIEMLTNISIGKNAGIINAGKDSIAIGNNSAISDQPDNSIVINATGSNFDITTNGLFISKDHFENILYFRLSFK